MSIADTILSGLKFGAGGANEHTARVAQAQVNRKQQDVLDADDARKLSNELYASGVDITSDGRGMSVGAREQLATDEGRRRMARMWNSQRQANQWRDSNGNIMSTEIVDFQEGPNGGIVPIVKGHNGKLAPMTERRSNSDGDNVMELTPERFEQWSNELYTSTLATAGADFVMGGELGKIDAARGNALAIAGRNGSKNNAAIKGIAEMTGGDPEATSAGIAMIADAPEEGTDAILGEMGIDPSTVGQEFSSRIVEQGSMAPPTGQAAGDPTASAPSLKPTGDVDAAAAHAAAQARLAEVEAELRGASKAPRDPITGRPMETGGDLFGKEQRRALVRERAQLRKQLKDSPVKGAKVDRHPITGQPMDVPDNLAGDKSAGQDWDKDETFRQAGVPTDFIGKARDFIGKFGITKEAVELDEARRTAVKDGDMVALDRLVGKKVSDIDHADIRAVLDKSSGPISPTQVREDIQNGTGIGDGELAATQNTMQAANITDVRDIRGLELDKAMEAARVIAMMSDGNSESKMKMYGSLVNYVQTGSFTDTPADIANAQTTAANSRRAAAKDARKPGLDAIEHFREDIDHAQDVWASDIYNLESTGKGGRTFKSPSGTGREAFNRLMGGMRTFDNHFKAGRVSEEDYVAQVDESLRMVGTFMLADASSRKTSIFNVPAAWRDFWSNSETTANGFERMVIASRDKNGNPKNIQIVRPDGSAIDGEVSMRSFTRTMPVGMARQLVSMLEENTQRLRPE